MKLSKAFVITIVLSITIGIASADTFNINLTVSNALPDGPVYGTVTINISGTAANITADPNDLVLIPGDNFGMQTFGFNPVGFLSITNLPTGWTIKDKANLSEFGIFLKSVDGTGSTRQNPLNFTVNFSQTFNPGDPLVKFFEPNIKGYSFAAHIGGFTNYGEIKSAWFADGPGFNGPEPGTTALLGIGLLGLALWARKRNKT